MFKKNIVVGVAITPEVGLEAVVLDCASKRVLKYGSKPIEYNVIQKEVDFDRLKIAMQDLLNELDIPKGSEITMCIPDVVFKVADYPASLDSVQIENAIEEELYEHPLFKDYEPSFSYSITNSTLQFNKVVYNSAQRMSIVEIIMIIKSLEYKPKSIITSVDSILNSLIYLDRVNAEAGTNWVLLVVENNCCRILSMLGNAYLDAFDETISIGEVLSDAENYATVISAVEPILKNIPSKYLCVVSKTNVISAEVLANKLTYSAPIIYQEANVFRKDNLIEFSSDVDSESAKNITLDIIGAGIYSEFEGNKSVNLNLFNKTLGDLYYNEQPPMLFDGKLVLTNEKLLTYFVIFALIVVVLFVAIFLLYLKERVSLNNQIEETTQQIQVIDEYLRQHSNVSAEDFDEGDEIRIGLGHNKNVYSYYTIVGTEIPQKLWLTHLKLGEKTTIEGQADNLESVYSFFRNIKDYNQDSDISLQKLGLASSGKREFEDLDTEAVLTSLNADFYEFRISNEPEQKANNNENNSNNAGVPKELELIN